MTPVPDAVGGRGHCSFKLPLRINRLDNMKRLAQRVAVAVVASILITLIWTAVDAVSAKAASGDRSPQPSPTATWGIGTAAWTTVPLAGDTGGWKQRQFGLLYPWPCSRQGCTSVEIKLTEPYRSGNELKVNVLGTALYAGADGAKGWFSMGTSTALQAKYVCQSSEWATARTTRTTVGSYSGAVVPDGQLSSIIAGPGVTIGTGGATCPYLVSIEMILTQHMLDTPTGNGSSKLTVLKWYAEDFYLAKKYVDQTTTELLCKGTGADQFRECFGIVNTDPSLYCSNPPIMQDALDFPYIPNAIQFYADCLFNPRGGWDRNKEITPAVNASMIGNFNTSLTSIANAFKFNTVCGTIVNGTGKIVPLTINTCTWTTWAAPIKVAIGAFLIVGFSLWAATFIARLITAVASGGRAPSPIEGGDDE